MFVDLIRVYKGWPYEKVIATYWTYTGAKKAKDELKGGRFKHILRRQK